MAAILLYGFPSDSYLDSLSSGSKELSFLIPEGRPLLWGAKELAPQLASRGWPVRLITDNMMAYCLSKDMIEEACIFSQKDTEEGAWGLTGSLILAIAAKAHGVPVKVLPAAKTFPANAEHAGEALFYLNDKRVAPEGIKGYAPLVELVPWKYIQLE